MSLCYRGSSNLYEMYLRAMKELMHLEWDYFHNMSESDFPIKPVEEVRKFSTITCF